MLYQQVSEFQNLSEYREDGRQNDQIRSIQCKLGIDSASNGSCRLKMGITEIICQIRGPKEKQNANSKQFVNVFYSVAPFSGIERRNVSKFDKDSSELAENLRVSFENLIVQESLGKSEIDIIVTILQGDGSHKSAIFNAITLSLMDAGIQMRDLIISSTVGIQNQKFFIDLTHSEQRSATSEFVITYLPRQAKIDFMQLKCSKINLKDLESLKQLAIHGCILIHKELKTILLDNSLKKYLCSH